MAARSVLVTGASTGIGEACALLLERRGWTVFAGVRKDEDGERLRASASGSLEPVMLDVTDEAGVEKAALSIGESLGDRGLTAVVNNAGIAVGGPLEYLPLDYWRQQLEVNVIGQISVTKAVLPLLRRNGRGARVVFIGSISGRLSTPLMGPYGASKFALEAIAASARHELRPAGIDVILVEPGAIKTPIWDKGRATADQLESELRPEAHERYGTFIAAVRKGIEMQDSNGIAPVKVAEVVERSLTTARPRARYLVGKDAVVQAAMARMLPDRVLDVLVRRVVGP